MKISLVSLENISISFKKQKVINNVWLDIFEGEFVSIIGKSGVGKSTLLNVLLGEITEYTGRIIYKGDITKTIVFQDYSKSLFPWYTVFENMKIVGSKPNVGEIDYYLKLVGLENEKTKFPWQLSGGMQQRLAIARALLLKPRMLLMDEPFGSLDYNLKDDLEEVLHGLHQNLNLTFVFVTHDISSALYLSDKIYLLASDPELSKTFKLTQSDYVEKSLIPLSTLYQELKLTMNRS